MKMNIVIVDANDSYVDYDDDDDVSGDITLFIFIIILHTSFFMILFVFMSHLFIIIIGWKHSSHDG